MKAAVCREFGADLTLEDVVLEEPGPEQVEVTLRAVIEECGERKTIVKCRLYSGDTLTTAAKVIAVRVPNSWKE